MFARSARRCLSGRRGLLSPNLIRTVLCKVLVLDARPDNLPLNFESEALNLNNFLIQPLHLNLKHKPSRKPKFIIPVPGLCAEGVGQCSLEHQPETGSLSAGFISVPRFMAVFWKF